MRAVTACVWTSLFAVSIAVLRGSGPPDDIAGQLAGHTQLYGVPGGSSTLNIVILGDGFTSAQMPKYRDAAKRYVDDLRATAPFETMEDAIAIYRVDVVSQDAGIDVPATCDGKDIKGANRQSTPVGHNNALKVKWCGDGTRLNYPGSTNEALVRQFAVESGVFPHLTIVLLNDWMFGAAAWADGALKLAGGDESGGVAYVSIEKNLTGDTDPSGKLQTPFAADTVGFPTDATHETGHLGPFYLLDEYPKGKSALPSDEHDTIDESPNLSRTFSPLKWQELVPPGALATNCPDPPTPPSPTEVDAGAVLGGFRFATGVYHPRCSCRMHTDTKRSFCIVCRQTILDRLSGYLPDNAGLSIVLDSIRVTGNDGKYALEYKIEGAGLPTPLTGRWPASGFYDLKQNNTLELNKLMKQVPPPSPGSSSAGLPTELKLTYTLKRKVVGGSDPVEPQTHVTLKFSDVSGARIQAINATDHRLTLALIARR